MAATGFDTITAGQWVTATLFLFVGTAGVGTVAFQLRSKPPAGREALKGSRDDAG